MSLKIAARALRGPRRRVALIGTTLVAAGLVALLAWPATPASAHCDSVDGPVATAARSALEKGDVKLVLPYVKADQETELTVAFEQTMDFRRHGPEAARQFADRYFVETAVRLHRVGEGASYTGLKDHVEADPALEAAEKSLQEGKPDQVIAVLDHALREEIATRYQGVLNARAAEAAKPSVETARERVEAELMFEKYVLDIGGAIHGATSHSEAPSHSE